MKRVIIFPIVMTIFLVGCKDHRTTSSKVNPYDYTGLSRLTDPGPNVYMLIDLPDDITSICDIANVQLLHYRMLSQRKIPMAERKTAFADHDIKDILDTLRVKGVQTLSLDRTLENRVNGGCTKESIFLTSLLRYKGIPARIRLGYLTNLYRGDKAVEFWQNVNQYERIEPLDPHIYDSLTLSNADVNRSIEHWITEYWDNKTGKWRILDARPEFLEAHGVELEVQYHLKENENFEYAWQVWLRRNSEDLIEEAYAERGWNARTHIRYQLLMDFYSLLNHDGPAIFEENGRQTEPTDERRIFIEKDFDTLTDEELKELDELANLLAINPSVEQLIDFYLKSNTLKIPSMEEDRYSFVYIHKKNVSGLNSR
jgi:hypothetical protein